MSARERWTGAEAGRVLDRADRSGLTDAAFAERHGLCPKRLSAWRKRLGRGKRGGKRRFVEIRTRVSERIEIELRNGRRLVVSSTLDSRVAAEFADALEGAGDC